MNSLQLKDPLSKLLLKYPGDFSNFKTSPKFLRKIVIKEQANNNNGEKIEFLIKKMRTEEIVEEYLDITKEKSNFDIFVRKGEIDFFESWDAKDLKNSPQEDEVPHPNPRIIQK